ncbi:hypothetical protein KUCAC02_003274, partial [Chaenocephalus aceratus]
AMTCNGPRSPLVNTGLPKSLSSGVSAPRAPLEDFVLILQGFCRPLTAPGFYVGDRTAQR